MGKPDAPTPPDPYAVSAAQTQSNVATAQTQAQLNAVDQYNPYGGTSFLRDAHGDPYGQISQLTPELQWLLGGQEGLGGGLTGVAGNMVDNLPGTNINAPSPNEVGQDAFKAQMGMLQPQFDLQNKNMETMMTDRGIPVGSEAWNNAYQGLRTSQDNAMGVAANSGQVSGAQEQNTLFGQNLTQQQLPYNELAQVLAENPTNNLLNRAPNAIPTSPTAVQPTNVSGNVYQSYNDSLAAYNQQNQNMANLLTGTAVLGKSFLGPMLSDENMKENKRSVDHEGILLDLGKLPIKHYDYTDEAKSQYSVPEHRTGPMAQDYADIFGGDGHTIDLGDMAGHMLAAIQALEQRTAHLAK